MTKKQEIKLFEDKKVRTVWDDEKEKWFFCVVDVVEALTDSKNPTDYIKKMKKRDPELSKGWGQIVTPLSVQTAGGKQRVNCAPRDGIFRIIQAIPSPKAEPFKRWMAQVASQRLDQMQDPELSIDQAIVDYRVTRDRFLSLYILTKMDLDEKKRGMPLWLILLLKRSED
jgi:prophage antirepressor-like protein